MRFAPVPTRNPSVKKNPHTGMWEVTYFNGGLNFHWRESFYTWAEAIAVATKNRRDIYYGF